MIKGMDISSLTEVERCGGRFYDHGREKDLMEILKSYGTNYVRLRLWNDPYAPDGRPYGCSWRGAHRHRDLGVCSTFITVISGRIRANRPFRKPGAVWMKTG